MGFRFGKSIRIGKALRVNISKRGIGASIGVKGFRVGVGPKGVQTTASIPGTGIKYVGRSAPGSDPGSHAPDVDEHPAAPAKKGLSWCGIIALVIGCVFAGCVCLGIVGSLRSPSRPAQAPEPADSAAMAAPPIVTVSGSIKPPTARSATRPPPPLPKQHLDGGPVSVPRARE